MLTVMNVCCQIIDLRRVVRERASIITVVREAGITAGGRVAGYLLLKVKEQTGVQTGTEWANILRSAGTSTTGVVVVGWFERGSSGGRVTNVLQQDEC